MRRRPWPLLGAVAVSLLGLTLVALGVLRATVLAPEQATVLRVSGPTGAPIIEALPGMLELAGADVTVTATASGGEPVFLGIGRTADVQAYLGDVARQQISGLDGDGAPLGQRRGGSGSAPNPAAVDVWAHSSSDTGQTVLQWEEQPGQWSLIAATDGGGSGPTSLTMTWPHEFRRSSAPAVIALGVLMLVGGLVALALLLARVREEEPAS